MPVTLTIAPGDPTMRTLLLTSLILGTTAYRGTAGEPESASAFIEVRLPADAELLVDGSATKPRGPLRTFTTPPLEQGFVYTYRLEARWTARDGKPRNATRRVDIRPGQRFVVDFMPPPDAIPQPKRGFVSLF